MSELDPNILKRNLPEDIHVAIDQVNANLEAAVKDVVSRFKAHADEVADQFERRQFSPELAQKLAAIQEDLDRDLIQLEQTVRTLKTSAEQACHASATVPHGKLTESLDSVVEQTKELSAKLSAFRQKTVSFGEKTGGLIAKAALKTFTGGIG